eukprot:GHVS01063458.1.p1 GENE.GHVS01063458.1~~GHVS01063458.1.p1  ORF type:complete len:368 (+),score=42.90 GHVS01063458.1:448-1551(+)
MVESSSEVVDVQYSAENNIVVITMNNKDCTDFPTLLNNLQPFYLAQSGTQPQEKDALSVGLRKGLFLLRPEPQAGEALQILEVGPDNGCLVQTMLFAPVHQGLDDLGVGPDQLCLIEEEGGRNIFTMVRDSKNYLIIELPATVVDNCDLLFGTDCIRDVPLARNKKSTRLVIDRDMHKLIEDRLGHSEKNLFIACYIQDQSEIKSEEQDSELEIYLGDGGPPGTVKVSKSGFKLGMSHLFPASVFTKKGRDDAGKKKTCGDAKKVPSSFRIKRNETNKTMMLHREYCTLGKIHEEKEAAAKGQGLPSTVPIRLSGCVVEAKARREKVSSDRAPQRLSGCMVEAKEHGEKVSLDRTVSEGSETTISDD